jgi:hypothetical protein
MTFTEVAMTRINSRLIAALLLMAALSACTGEVAQVAPAQAPSNTDQEIRQLVLTVDNEVRKELGVGLASFGMLLQSGSGSLLLTDALDGAEWAGIEELVRAGLVTTETIDSANGQYIRLLPTPKGREYLAALGRQSRS